MRILRDAQFALRTLIRTPGFTAVVVLTLALGIGSSTAIFSVVHAVVLRPLAYPEPQQLVRITSELRGFGATDTGVAAPELIDYQSRTDLFAAVAGLVPVSANVTSGGTPERVEMMLVSGNYFSVLGVAPAHGRIFGPADETPGVANLAVVSDGFWRRRLSADPQAIGRTIAIDTDRIMVVGVMPPGFRHPGRTLQSQVDVWSPAGFGSGTSAPSSRSRRRLEGCLARLQPGVTLEQAQARLAEYGAVVSQQFAADYPAQNGWRPLVIPLHEDTVGSVATPMFVLLCGVFLLLLVACVNVAHLVLARSSGRRQEMAIRQALGATGSRLTWQLVTESALLAAAGGALAVLVASWGLRGLIALAPGRVPRIDEVRLDFPAVLVTGLISLAVTALFGFVPAVHARRTETMAGLKEGGPGRSADRRSGRARDVLVAAEVAMATVLLIGAGLLVRSVVGLLNVPVGFETDHLLTARIALPRPNDIARATYLEPARRIAFYRETLRRISALPGVEHVAMSSQIPLGGFNPPLFVEINGRDTGDPGFRPVIHHFQVSPSYFETMGVRIVKGRPFGESDRAGGEPVAVVSDTAARLFWRGRDPIGERVRFAPDAPWMTVIGVAADVLNRRLSEQPQPILYRSLEQSSDLSMALLIRTVGDTLNLGEHVAREVRAVDPDLPVYSVRTMAGLIEAAVAQRRFLMRLLVAFGIIATALALLGIYGVMAYAVSQRTREIGIRLAIGARQVDVARMVMRRGMALTAAGVVVGIGTSLGLSPLVRSQLFGVQPSDPMTMGSVLVLMTVVAAAAAYLPARRAARVDPAVTLRSQ
jgi:putative ABC transport system permease protein